MHSSEFYRLIEHTADIGVEVEGKTLTDVIEKLLLAFYDLHVLIDEIQEKFEKKLKGEGRTIEDSLVLLLEDALFLFDTEGFIGKKVDVSIEKESIYANVSGEYFNPKRHTPKFEIKAVTYHQLSVKKTKRGYMARVVFDV